MKPHGRRSCEHVPPKPLDAVLIGGAAFVSIGVIGRRTATDR